jgi:hypothetical protein
LCDGCIAYQRLSHPELDSGSRELIRSQVDARDDSIIVRSRVDARDDRKMDPRLREDDKEGGGRKKAKDCHGLAGLAIVKVHNFGESKKGLSGGVKI